MAKLSASQRNVQSLCAVADRMIEPRIGEWEGVDAYHRPRSILPLHGPLEISGLISTAAAPK